MLSNKKKQGRPMEITRPPTSVSVHWPLPLEAGTQVL